jgi:hypothetical protein
LSTLILFIDYLSYKKEHGALNGRIGGGEAKKPKQMITARIKHDKGLQVLQVAAGEGTNQILCTQNTHAASAGSCLGQADESKS